MPPCGAVAEDLASNQSLGHCCYRQSTPFGSRVIVHGHCHNELLTVHGITGATKKIGDNTLAIIVNGAYKNGFFPLRQEATMLRGRARHLNG